MMYSFIEDDKEKQDFALRAASNFTKNPKNFTYTDGEIERGCMFAMRYGLDGNCVVIFRIGSEFEPINYQNIIDLPEKN